MIFVMNAPLFIPSSPRWHLDIVREGMETYSLVFSDDDREGDGAFLTEDQLHELWSSREEWQQGTL